jgi:hypothetical protein
MIVIDSAASHHMVRDRSLFKDFINEKIDIKTGNPHSKLTAVGFGTASILTNGKVLELKNCLLVPSISQQLISLVRLIEDSIHISKKDDRFEISNNSGILLTGEIVDNLLHSSYSKVPSAFISTVDHTLWHNRLGHPKDHVMQLMNLPVSTSKGLCEVCNCSKLTLNPFKSHFSPVQSPLQRLHMDLVGPINPPSLSGFKYFMTIVDQYSSFKFV